jgi:erythronate-4-phosphate dehydrogenase
MKILADQYLYRLDELIPDTFRLDRFDPAAGFPADAKNYDALLIRTVTKINDRTLPEAGNLTFIGTATAGFDHIDLHHLQHLGITFARSAGCNARAVAEYVVTGLYRWAETTGIDPTQKTVGVVGAGHTGSAVIRLLEKLGIPFVPFDPPKALREPGFSSAPPGELMACDILTFHTPLTGSGPHPTRHMCDHRWLKSRFDLIINAARGGVVNETDLLASLQKGETGAAIQDVWENEPLFSDDVARRSLIATPHIAGYSREAKTRASRMVTEALCRHFGVTPPASFREEQLPPEILNRDIPERFARFLWNFNQIDRYDTEQRKLIGLPDAEKARKFACLRAETPTRFEFQSILKALEPSAGLPSECDVFRDDEE